MNHNYKKILSYIIVISIAGCLYGFTTFKKPAQTQTSWCDRKLRPELKKLTEIKVKSHWFKVYKVGKNVYAILEPYNYEEVISFVILGNKKALLFDTGMGMDSISPIVKQLTHLPVIVLNSHTHFDHIGGNYEFNNILAMNTAFTRKNASDGDSHAVVAAEVTPASFCMEKLPGLDTAHYHTRPFKVSKFINDGYVIDLGGRKLQVIAAPGHTPDEIALFDKRSGYLWVGDSFYQGPIFLFEPETDLKAYQRSIKKLASMVPQVKRVFPSHNLPTADPALLVKANADFNAILNGKKHGTPNDDGTVLFKYDQFSFLIRKSFLK